MLRMDTNVLMQFEFSRRKDTAEKLFLIYEYVDNGS